MIGYIEIWKMMTNVSYLPRKKYRIVPPPGRGSRRASTPEWPPLNTLKLDKGAKIGASSQCSPGVRRHERD